MFFQNKKKYNFRDLNVIGYDYEDEIFTISHSEMEKLLSQKNTFIEKMFGNSEYLKKVEELKENLEIEIIKKKIIETETENHKYEHIVFDYFFKYIFKNEKLIDEIKATEEGAKLIKNIIHLCEKYPNSLNKEQINKFLYYAKKKQK